MVTHLLQNIHTGVTFVPKKLTLPYLDFNTSMGQNIIQLRKTSKRVCCSTYSMINSAEMGSFIASDGTS